MGDYVYDATLVVVLDCILYEVEQYKLYVLPICQYLGILYFFLGNDYSQILVFDLLRALPEEAVEQLIVVIFISYLRTEFLLEDFHSFYLALILEKQGVGGLFSAIVNFHDITD